uniref:Transposase n=1 Tax=Globodera rostochiensis TaxID=31243 RepID=A0A914HP90_GLORO
MDEFWILIFFFAINSLDKAESVKFEETPHKIFDEIFGEGWWNKDKAVEWNKLTLEQNLHQIDRQNTQIGQRTIEPNSTDQLGQIQSNSTDQNPPLTESDHSDNAKNGEELIAEDERKHETVAKELGLGVRTIYNWKSELGQTAPNKYPHSEQKELMKLYYEIKGQNPKISDENIAKILIIGGSTLYKWKKQFKRHQFHPNSVDGHSVEENAAANVQKIGKNGQ